MNKENNVQDFIPFVEQLAKSGGEIIRHYFNGSYNIQYKEDLSPVTIADKETEKKMRELIRQKFPHHGIMGEEFEDINVDAEYKWMLDPIDGTKSFIAGVPLFGSLIALLHNDQPVLGAIVQPLSGNIMLGYEKGTFLNSRRVRVNEQSDLGKALLLTTDVKDIVQYQNKQHFEKLLSQVALFRTWGDCFGYFLLAKGNADIMLDPIMSPWDIMALVPIIRGAGGIITDYQGNDPVLGNSIVATTSALHEQVISILNGG